MFRKALFGCGAVMAFVLLVPARLAAADAPDLAGQYSVTGTNANGKDYHGVVTIKKVGDIYRVTWLIGKEEHHGVGLVEGDVLAVAWAIVAGGDDAGLVAYRIKKDGTLEGKWIDNYERGGVLPETLSPAK